MSAAGPVIWITGLAGAGKTTLAEAVVLELKKERANVVHVDGDTMRELFGAHLGHSQEDRMTNAYNICRACRWLSAQGMIVVCSTMSLYPEIWAWNRDNFEHYLQVYVKVSFEVLQLRNKKTLYSTDSTDAKNVVGLGLPFNEPTDSDLVLSNESDLDLKRNVDLIVWSVLDMAMAVPS